MSLIWRCVRWAVGPRRVRASGMSRACRATIGAVVATLVMSSLIMLPAGRANAATVDTNNRQSVTDAYLNVWKPANAVPMSWSGSVSTCAPGSVSAAAQQATLDTVNFYRSMAGLDPVTFDPALSGPAQEEALLIAANGKLTHSPDPSSTCYTTRAATAASRSNLDFGAAGAQAVDLYMSDNGVPQAGHRRWVLYPDTLTMGSGSTDISNALYVIPNWLAVISSASVTATAGTFTNPTWVTWPTSGYFPRQLEPGGQWSLSAAGRGFDFTSASVSVVGPAGSVPVTIQPLAQGYGNDTLVWQLGSTVPTLLGTDTATYSVTVNGIKNTSGRTVSYSYQVHMFNPEPGVVTAAAPVSTDGCGTTSDAYTIPSTPNVDYLVGGVVKLPGTYSTNGSVAIQVEARSQSGFTLVGTTAWGLWFDTNQCTLTGTPTPTIAGTATVKSILTATPGSWTPASVTLGYQWNRVSGGTSTPISGATSATYTLTTADVGATITVSVTGSKTGYATVTQTSATTAAVTSPIPGTFVGFVPSRMLDTRDGTGAAKTAVAASGTVALQVTGRGGVPATGVSAVVLNVTVTDTQAPGYVTAYPSGTTKPLASNLNFLANTTIPNLVVVKVGSNGQVNLYNGSTSSIDLVADIAGYYLS